MTQKFAGSRWQSSRVTSALISAVALLLAPAILSSEASAQFLGYASSPQRSFPSDNAMPAPAQPALTDEGDASESVVPERLRRAVVSLDTREVPGTIIIDTGSTALSQYNTAPADPNPYSNPILNPSKPVKPDPTKPGLPGPTKPVPTDPTIIKPPPSEFRSSKTKRNYRSRTVRYRNRRRQVGDPTTGFILSELPIVQARFDSN